MDVVVLRLSSVPDKLDLLSYGDTYPRLDVRLRAPEHLTNDLCFTPSQTPYNRANDSLRPNGS